MLINSLRFTRWHGWSAQQSAFLRWTICGQAIMLVGSKKSASGVTSYEQSCTKQIDCHYASWQIYFWWCLQPFSHVECSAATYSCNTSSCQKRSSVLLVDNPAPNTPCHRICQVQLDKHTHSQLRTQDAYALVAHGTMQNLHRLSYRSFRLDSWLVCWQCILYRRGSTALCKA